MPDLNLSTPPGAPAPSTGTPEPIPAAPGQKATPPRLAPAPPTGPTESATQRASREARERLSKGQPAIEPGTPAHPSLLQERGDDGKFKPKAQNATPAPPGPTNEADDGGQAQPAPEHQGEPPAPEEGAEPGAEGAEPPGEESDTEGIAVKIPGRGAGQEYEIMVSDQETADRLRQLVNGYQRSEDTRAQITKAEERLGKQWQEIQEVQEMVETDPAGFVIDAIPPNVQADVALYLLTQPHVWERLGNIVLSLDDPDRLELYAAKAAKARLEMKDTLRVRSEERKVMVRNAQEVRGAIAKLAPADFTDEKKQQFWTDAVRDMKDYADRMGLKRIDPKHVPVVLAQRLAQYGIDPVEAAARLAAPDAPQGRPAARGTPAPTAQKGAPAGATPPQQKTGQEFVRRSAEKRAAAAAAPPGERLPSTVPTPPPNQTIAERSAWARKNFKFNRQG